MGRGRAKAKQTKVARRLKYGVPQTDLERLEAELQGRSSDDEHVEDAADDSSDDDDPYAAYLDEADDQDGDRHS